MSLDWGKVKFDPTDFIENINDDISSAKRKIGSIEGRLVGYSSSYKNKYNFINKDIKRARAYKEELQKDVSALKSDYKEIVGYGHQIKRIIRSYKVVIRSHKEYMRFVQFFLATVENRMGVNLVLKRLQGDYSPQKMVAFTKGVVEGISGIYIKKADVFHIKKYSKQGGKERFLKDKELGVFFQKRDILLDVDYVSTLFHEKEAKTGWASLQDFVNKYKKIKKELKELNGILKNNKRVLAKLKAVIVMAVTQIGILSGVEEEGERLLLKLEEEQEDSSEKQKRIKGIKKRIKSIIKQRVEGESQEYQDEIVRLLKMLKKKNLSKAAKKRIERTIKGLEEKIKLIYEREEYREGLIKKRAKKKGKSSYKPPYEFEEEDIREIEYILHKRKTYHRGVIGCSFVRKDDINVIGSTIINN